MVKGGDHLPLAHANILHSSMLDDIPGIFCRFTLWKKERVWAGRIELTYLEY
jgi:hypothetical protein